MEIAVFNTLEFSRRLREAGFTAEQSDTITSAMHDVALVQMFTKADGRELENRLLLKMGGLIVAVVGFFTLIEKFLQ